MEIVAYDRGSVLLNQERKILELIFRGLLEVLAW